MDTSGGNPFAVLTAVVAPAILTNACSVLALGTSNRLARVVDRTRVVARMVSSAETEAASDETAAQRRSAELRSQGWEAQLAGLQVRTQLLVKALRAIYGSLGLFAMAALVSVAGSIVTIKGSNLAGTHVAVTFDALPAHLFYNSSTQINLRVPEELAFMQAAQVIVTVDGQVAAQTVPLAIAAPAIFTGGVLNADNTHNNPVNPAAAGSVIEIVATGLASPRSGAITVRIQDHSNLMPLSVGQFLGIAGLQTVKVTVPSDLGGVSNATLSVCAVASDPNQPVCSASVSFAVK